MNLQYATLINCSEVDADALSKARALILQVCATPLFAGKLLAATLTETQGKTNLQVLSDITEMDLTISVNLYSSWWSHVIGYTYFATNTIHVNRKYFHGTVSIASNLLHECSHILGYTHDQVWATSVPYTLNRIFEDCCLELKLSG